MPLANPSPEWTSSRFLPLISWSYELGSASLPDEASRKGQWLQGVSPTPSRRHVCVVPVYPVPLSRTSPLPSNAARDDFNAALMAYKRRELMETLSLTQTDGQAGDGGSDESVDVADSVGVVDSAVVPSPRVAGGDKPSFRAAGALMFPGLDRGRSLWEEDNYQSSRLIKTVPVPLGGFFANGVAGDRTSSFPHELCPGMATQERVRSRRALSGQAVRHSGAGVTVVACGLRMSCVTPHFRV